jgi:serine/threonine protein kinase
MSQKTVVFKIYPDMEGRAAHKREVDLFESLGNRHSDVIVEYFGSFAQNDKFVIILEYANGGNLWDFYKTNGPPNNPQELTDFWTELMKLMFALHHLHNLETRPGSRLAW